MRAAVYYGKEDLRIEDAPEPAAGVGMVVVRVAYAGICGSDLHFYYSPETSRLDFARPHPLTGARAPQILGHEFAGVVAEVGEGVDHVVIGDAVTVWPVYYCGTCAACASGRFNACRTVAFHGCSSDGGGLAEYTAVPADRVVKLPPGVDLVKGALVEPMAVSWHAVAQAGVEPGVGALVLGAGPIGIGAALALRARGVSPVLLAEPSRHRAVVAARLADIVVIDPSDDLAVAVAAETRGRGVDVVIEASGSGQAVLGGLDVLNPGGRLVVVAAHQRPLELSLPRLVWSERRLIGSLAHVRRDYDEVLGAMASGRYDELDWVSVRPLEGLIEALHELRRGERTKILIEIAGKNPESVDMYPKMDTVSGVTYDTPERRP